VDHDNSDNSAHLRRERSETLPFSLLSQVRALPQFWGSSAQPAWRRITGIARRPVGRRRHRPGLLLPNPALLDLAPAASVRVPIGIAVVIWSCDRNRNTARGPGGPCSVARPASPAGALPQPPREARQLALLPPWGSGCGTGCWLGGGRCGAEEFGGGGGAVDDGGG
jgi:hypothetical protein